MFAKSLWSLLKSFASSPCRLRNSWKLCYCHWYILHACCWERDCGASTLASRVALVERRLEVFESTTVLTWCPKRFSHTNLSSAILQKLERDTWYSQQTKWGTLDMMPVGRNDAKKSQANFLLHVWTKCTSTKYSCLASHFLPLGLFFSVLFSLKHFWGCNTKIVVLFSCIFGMFIEITRGTSITSPWITL